MISTSRFTCAITRFNANTITVTTETLLCLRTICGTPQHSRSSLGLIYVTLYIKNHTFLQNSCYVIISTIYIYILFYFIFNKAICKKNSSYKKYFRSQGHSDAWDELIYPGMKQGLVGSLLASQEAMDRRKNSFELYGADFMVMEDFSVWLIEINSHPDMSYSTSVTTRLCRQVMEDTIKGS